MLAIKKGSGLRFPADIEGRKRHIRKTAGQSKARRMRMPCIRIWFRPASFVMARTSLLLMVCIIQAVPVIVQYVYNIISYSQNL